MGSPDGLFGELSNGRCIEGRASVEREIIRSSATWRRRPPPLRLTRVDMSSRTDHPSNCDLACRFSAVGLIRFSGRFR